MCMYISNYEVLIAYWEATFVMFGLSVPQVSLREIIVSGVKWSSMFTNINTDLMHNIQRQCFTITTGMLYAALHNIIPELQLLLRNCGRHVEHLFSSASSLFCFYLKSFLAVAAKPQVTPSMYAHFYLFPCIISWIINLSSYTLYQCILITLYIHIHIYIYEYIRIYACVYVCAQLFVSIFKSIIT